MTIRREFYGWRLVAVLWLLDFMNMGFPLYGGAVINTYMLKEIPMSRSTFGLGFTLLNLFVGLPAVAVGASITMWGIRRTFAIGSAVILLGAAWMAVVVTQPWQYLLGFGVLIGTGIKFWNDRASSNSDHAVVQKVSRKNDGGGAERFGVCGIFRVAADEPNFDGERRELEASLDNRDGRGSGIGDRRISAGQREARRFGTRDRWRGGHDCCR